MRAHSLLPFLLLAACAAKPELVAKVKNAGTAGNLPKVVGCYENAFENAGFVGEYDLVVDLDVEGGTGKVVEADVTDVTVVKGKLPEGFTDCVTSAFRASTIAPGGAPSLDPLRIRNMRIAFRDGSSSARAAAGPAGQPILVGPRADRCLGLYGHAPPRPLGELQQELAEARAKAASAHDQDPDAEARALQHAYDVALELRRRIEADGWRPDVAPEARKRLALELANVERLAVELGAKIGCVPNAE
ncbi:MAG: hypothetical protein FJ096_03980 [Deltaproteobacteria bacterium]|nr:hypothetical protein [Deltaproteobacteria bacterium]